MTGCRDDDNVAPAAERYQRRVSNDAGHAIPRIRWQPSSCLVQSRADPGSHSERPLGIRVAIHDLDGIRLFNQDVEVAGEPPKVIAFKQAIETADALLVATPEYNHGVPGVLKNAIDWASRPRATSPLLDKPVAVMGASPGRGSTARAQAQLRDAFVFMGACVLPLPEILIGSATSHFDEDDDLVDAEIRASVVELVEALRDWTKRLRRVNAA